MNKKALICGITGQDGTYLAKLLLDKGYSVHGTTRSTDKPNLANLRQLGVSEKVTIHCMAIEDLSRIQRILQQVKPDEIYNLAGESSVALSFEQPAESMKSISVGTLNLLEAIRITGQLIKIYNAGSSECFGGADGVPCDEHTPFRPCSPYAVAKSSSFWNVANYREAYHLFACTGILFNHESPLRPEHFVTQKIVKTACRIAAGSREILYLGDITIARDWGWASEYVEAMWLMLQQNKPSDYVIATGETNTLEEFLAEVFRNLDLDWREHVLADQSFLRPLDITISKANPSLASEVLGWRAKYRMKDVVRMMIDEEQRLNSKQYSFPK
jgi:GDPmannose 4,6-dehydratase